MTAVDARGCRVSGASENALESFERALGGCQSWIDDPRAVDEFLMDSSELPR